MKVVAVHTAPSSQAPMVSRNKIEAVAGKGLVGDRHYGKYSKGQITVVSTDELALAEADLGYAIEPGSTRRNITVAGLELPRTPGAQLKLGEVVIEVYRDASPCTVMEESVGPGSQPALKGRSGIRGLIIQGGTLRVGDDVEFMRESPKGTVVL